MIAEESKESWVNNVDDPSPTTRNVSVPLGTTTMVLAVAIKETREIARFIDEIVFNGTEDFHEVIVSDDNDEHYVALFVLHNPTITTADIVISYNDGAEDVKIKSFNLLYLSGTDTTGTQASDYNKNGSFGDDTNSPVGSSISGVLSGSAVIASCIKQDDDLPVLTPSSGVEIGYNSRSGEYEHSSNYQLGVSGSVDGNFTKFTGNGRMWVQAMFELKEDGVSGGIEIISVT